jgi:hypothetical protein
MEMLYILNGQGEPELTTDPLKWSIWFEQANRTVGYTDLGDIGAVSTTFLGLNHNWGSGPPILWETMVFGGPEDLWQERYASKAEALQGHRDKVEHLLREYGTPSSRELSRTSEPSRLQIASIQLGHRILIKQEEGYGDDTSDHPGK